MKTQQLLAFVREGRDMTRTEKVRLIIEMSVPSVLAQISSVLMFFIDAAMVGSLGERQSAAIGIVETATWLFTGLCSACSMGFSVQVAHSIGASDFDRARDILRQAIVCCAIFSGTLMLIATSISHNLPVWLGGTEEIRHEAGWYYFIFGLSLPFFQLQHLSGSMLKCSGDMRTPSIMNVAMCVMDVAFNYLFIFVLGLGVIGAAMGTMLAVGTSSITMFSILVLKSDKLALAHRRGRFLPQRNVVRNAFKIGAPMGLQQALMGSAQVVSTAIVAPLGTVAIAANSFAITVESICYMPGYGIADAATTLVGQGIGAGQRLLTRSFARLSVMLGMLVMSFMGVLMYAFAPELMAVMSPVESIRELGADVLRIEAFAEPFFAAAIVCYGVFVGAGDTLRPALINLSTMWLVRLSLAALLATQYGLRGVWTAMAVELTFRGLLFLARLRGFNKQTICQAALTTKQ